MLNHRKSRDELTSESRLIHTLEPKGMELGYHGSFNVVTDGHIILGSLVAPKVSRSIHGVELGKPNAFPEIIVGRNSVRKDKGVVGRGNGKKRKVTCNELHRGLMPQPERVLTYQEGVSIVRTGAKL